MSKQTKAQRLADELEQDPITGRLGFVSVAAAELRMLEAENESLRQQNTEVDAACAKLEAANAELLGALKEGADWTQEFVSQMRSYTISDKAAESLTRQLAAIEKHGGTR